jgi:hypothetical protein
MGLVTAVQLRSQINSILSPATLLPLLLLLLLLKLTAGTGVSGGMRTTSAQDRHAAATPQEPQAPTSTDPLRLPPLLLPPLLLPPLLLPPPPPLLLLLLKPTSHTGVTSGMWTALHCHTAATHNSNSSVPPPALIRCALRPSLHCPRQAHASARPR